MDRLGAILGRLGAILGRLGAILGRLGRILARLGAILARLGRILASQRPSQDRSKRPPRPSQNEVQHRPQLGSLRGPKNLIKRLRKSKKKKTVLNVNGKRVQKETTGDHVVNLFDPFKSYIWSYPWVLPQTRLRLLKKSALSRFTNPGTS